MANLGKRKRGREPGEFDAGIRRRKAGSTPPDIHFIYRPDDQSVFDNACIGQVINVLVLAKHLYQPPLNTAKLFGGCGPNDFYHPDSDIVVAAVHAGKFHPSTLPDNLYGACIEVLIHPGQQRYCPKERCNIRSKPCYTPAEISFQPIQIKLFYESSKPNRRKQRPRRLQTIGKERVVMFDNTNRLQQGYHISHIRDRGFEEKDFTSTRFKGECLYLGSGEHQYELSLIWKQINNEKTPAWQWCRLTQQAIEVLIASAVMADCLPKLTVPLDSQFKEVVVADLAWDELIWDADGVTIRGMKFPLNTMEWKKWGDSLGDSDAYTEQDFFPDMDLADDRQDEQG